MLKDYLTKFITDTTNLVSTPSKNYYVDLFSLFDIFVRDGFVLGNIGDVNILNNLVTRFNNNEFKSMESLYIEYITLFLANINEKYTLVFNINTLNFNNYYKSLINNKTTLKNSIIEFCNVIYEWIKTGYVTYVENDIAKTIQFL